MSIGQILESPAMRAVIPERDALQDRLDAASAPAVRTAMEVTVVIPCFEQAEYLPKALASVLAQTVPALEVIVVDDGTTGDSVHEATKPFMADNFRAPTLVRYVRITNRGLPGARNTGLMLANGQAFLPLDADDWIQNTYLERTLPVLAAGADVVCVGLQEHGPTRNGTYFPGYDRALEQLTLEAEQQQNRLFYCSLFRTDLLRQVGGYNGRMVRGYEDWDLWIGLMARGVRLASVNEVLFNYRTRPDSMLADTEANWRQWNIDEMRRHHGF